MRFLLSNLQTGKINGKVHNRLDDRSIPSPVTWEKLIPKGLGQKLVQDHATFEWHHVEPWSRW